DPLFDRGVVRAAERDIGVAAGGGQAARMHERGDVPEPHRRDPAVLDPGDSRQPAGWDIDDAPRPLDASALDRPGYERDRAVAARGRVASIVEEDDAEVSPLVLRLGDEAAVHVCVPARLVDEQAPDMVELRRGEPPLVED